PELDRVVLKALEKKPSKRFNTAREFKICLNSASQQPVRTKNIKWEIIVILILLAVFGIILFNLVKVLAA
ncbi:MAG: hypothetical protein PF545_01710, partial [Elusimicrobia bacterium]|nr:hypothetical protein [Elusimicrobiota bacterium]